MSRNAVETMMGGLVLAAAAVFGVFAYQSSNMMARDGYSVTATFSSIDGLASGSDVRIGGIKIGTVSGQSLDPKTYNAVLTMNIHEEVKIPADSSASIVSESLLGGKYIAIAPGADDRMLEAGEAIEFTQSAVNLETLIGKFMFSGGGVENKSGDDSGPGNKDEDSGDESKPGSIF